MLHLPTYAVRNGNLSNSLFSICVSLCWYQYCVYEPLSCWDPLLALCIFSAVPQENVIKSLLICFLPIVFPHPIRMHCHCCFSQVQ